MQDYETTYSWESVPHDADAAHALAASLKIPVPLAKVLVGRGYGDPSDAELFLHPALSQLSDPFALPGVSQAVTRTLRAIAEGEKIVIYGDYDCDGVCATVLLLQILGQLGAVVDHFIPKRAEDGFGFRLGALDRVLEEHQPTLIITADCGMRSGVAVAEASRVGVDVIIVDHHSPYGAPRPDACAILHSVLDDVLPSMQSFSAVGLAFTFCRALRQAALEAKLESAEDVDIWKQLDLVTIGTVTDLMALQGDNRILVHLGLALLNDVSKRRPGILAMMRIAGLRTEIGSYEVGFLLGPRLSAAGRVGNAEVAIGLLMVDDPMEARRLAGQLDACYRERRRIEDVVLQAATNAVSGAVKKGASVLIAVGKNWHIGTIGIVAARISGRYNRPAVIISYNDKGQARGSCRSITGVDLEAALNKCSAHLISYGGYGNMAGFAIEKSEIPAFCKSFEKVCREYLGDEVGLETHEVDAWIDLSEVDDQLLDSIKVLQPLGLGNQTPTWGVRNVRIQGPPTIVGGNHLKCTVVSGGTQHDAIGYGLGDRTLPAEPLDMLFQLQRNHYRGRSILQLSIKDFRSSVI